jgi:hypothetical protein
MLVRVREGNYDPTDMSEGAPEPRGCELWTGHAEDITVMAFRDAGVEIEPGEWYDLQSFSALLEAAKPKITREDQAVYSTVTTRHDGVAGGWSATIGVREFTAALMVCRSVVQHVRRLGGGDQVWLRVE